MNLPDGPYVGVVDRFEEDEEGETKAVVILERDGSEVGDVVVPRSRLPQRARRQNAIVRVVLQEGDVAAVWYDAQATRDRGASAQARFDRIAKRAPRKDDENRDESEGGEGGGSEERSSQKEEEEEESEGENDRSSDSETGGNGEESSDR